MNNNSSRILLGNFLIELEYYFYLSIWASVISNMTNKFLRHKTLSQMYGSYECFNQTMHTSIFCLVGV
jgi:hypothetical protein